MREIRPDLTSETLTKFWPLIYSLVQEFWSLTEPHIEESAIRNNIPIELYLYSELGLGSFSIQDFDKRDPFTNPEQFEKVFVRLNVKGWIEPRSDGSYRVTEEARDAVRHIVRMGDTQLLDFKSMPADELDELAKLLGKVLAACHAAPEPPERWALIIRFRVADEYSPIIVQIRELLMDLCAYRDDAHLCASRPHFNQAGIIWLVLGALEEGEAVNAEQMAERMAFRGYEEYDFDIAIQAALELGWAEPAARPNTFRLTQEGAGLRAQAERLTEEYFYRPWSVLSPEELEELYALLTKLRSELAMYRKSRSGS
jgi:DNA-binding MarR family transcriptional regulator